MTISRRRWLAGAFAVFFVRPLGALLAGCGPEEPKVDPLLRVPMAEVPEEGRIERKRGDVVVELRREHGAIRVRSLICAHQLCLVEWRPDEQRYFCPCDKGLFGADGQVVYGPAKRPLRELDYTVEGDTVVVDTHQIYRAWPATEN